MAAMLAQTAKSIELKWTSLPCPERSRLDDQYLGPEWHTKLCSAPVPFFLMVHEELIKLWPLSGHDTPVPLSSPYLHW